MCAGDCTARPCSCHRLSSAFAQLAAHWVERVTPAEVIPRGAVGPCRIVTDMENIYGLSSAVGPFDGYTDYLAHAHDHHARSGGPAPIIAPTVFGGPGECRNRQIGSLPRTKGRRLWRWMLVCPGHG